MEKYRTVNLELTDMDVSENNGTPKSSILKGFSMINHPFGDTPILGTPRHVTSSKIVPVFKPAFILSFKDCVSKIVDIKYS